ncbi:MAG: heavy metal-binding domain-containing protein [Prolixibacteraceae bacterium]
MTTELTECPNCSTKFKGGLLSSVSLLNDNKTRIINEYHENKSVGYCNKCGSELYSKYKSQVQSERDNVSLNMQKLIDVVPVISTHSPLNWDYDILSMVTGQSTTGTGVISEFTSSFTDLFGAQSGRFNKKLKGGEDLCFAQLRKQALDLGGNAVIATDIDYSEVGGDKGILMVCMGGTAINLKNSSLLGIDRADKIKELAVLNARMKVLNSFDTGEF